MASTTDEHDGDDGHGTDDRPRRPRGRPLGSSVHELLAEAERLGPDPSLDGVDDDRLVTDLCTGAAELAAATSRWLVLLGEVVVRGLWAVDGARTPGVWLSWRLGIGSSTAREHVRVALRLRELPAIRDRFAAGTLSYSKVRAITRVADDTTEELLLRWADAATAAQLERIVRDTEQLHAATSPPTDDRDGLGLRTRWRSGGTLEVTLRLDAADGVAFEQRLERLVGLGDERRSSGPDGDRDVDRCGATDRDGDRAGGAATPGPATCADSGPAARVRRRWSHRAADAVVGAVVAAVEGGPDDTSGLDRHLAVIEVAATDALAAVISDPAHESDGARAPGRDRDRGEDEDHGGSASAASRPALVTSGRTGSRRRPVPLRQLRRFLCGAAIDAIAAAVDGHVDLGRTRRDPDARLRRLLVARDRTCRFPGCGAKRWLHAHHVVPWDHDGPTDLDNLVLLCGFHHRLVHSEGWVLEPIARGRWTFHPTDDGVALPEAAPPPPPVRDAVLTMLAQRARERDDDALLPPAYDGFGHDHEITVAVLLDRLRGALPRERDLTLAT